MTSMTSLLGDHLFFQPHYYYSYMKHVSFCLSLILPYKVIQISQCVSWDHTSRPRRLEFFRTNHCPCTSFSFDSFLIFRQGRHLQITIRLKTVRRAPSCLMSENKGRERRKTPVGVLHYTILQWHDSEAITFTTIICTNMTYTGQVITGYEPVQWYI